MKIDFNVQRVSSMLSEIESILKNPSKDNIKDRKAIISGLNVSYRGLLKDVITFTNLLKTINDSRLHFKVSNFLMSLEILARHFKEIESFVKNETNNNKIISQIKSLQKEVEIISRQVPISLN